MGIYEFQRGFGDVFPFQWSFWTYVRPIWLYPFLKMAKNEPKSMFDNIPAKDSYEEFLHMSKNTI